MKRYATLPGFAIYVKKQLIRNFGIMLNLDFPCTPFSRGQSKGAVEIWRPKK